MQSCPFVAPCFAPTCFFSNGKELLLKWHFMLSSVLSSFQCYEKCRYADQIFCLWANVWLKTSQFIVFAAAEIMQMSLKTWENNNAFPFSLRFSVLLTKRYRQFTIFCFVDETLQAKSSSSHQMRNYWRSSDGLWFCLSPWSGNKKK